MEEVFDWIPGYKGYYMVSTHARVLSVERKGCKESRYLKYGEATGGYYNVVLCKSRVDKWTVNVHLLVLLTFVGPQPDGYVSHHIDSDKHNNDLDNLEYITYKENSKHCWKNQRERKIGKYEENKNYSRAGKLLAWGSQFIAQHLYGSNRSSS